MSDSHLLTSNPSPGKIHAIIVEPEPTVASTLKDILNLSGYEAEAYSDPVEGLSAVLSESPDVVIAAVVMPQVDGIQLAIQAKLKCPDCKVLLWSADPEAAVLQKEAAAKGHHFEIFPKPLHPAVLLDKLRHAVSGPRVERELDSTQPIPQAQDLIPQAQN